MAAARLSLEDLDGRIPAHSRRDWTRRRLRGEHSAFGDSLAALWGKMVLPVRRRIGKAERRFLDLPIGPCQATIVLSHVFLPRRNTEDLKKCIWSIAVAVQLPACGAGSASRLAEVVHCRQEGSLPFWCDGELDNHQDGSRVWLGLDGQPRFLPVDGRLTVQVTGLRHSQEDSADNVQPLERRQNRNAQVPC